MQNAECRIMVCLAAQIEIIPEGNTIILHFAFCIQHFNAPRRGSVE